MELHSTPRPEGDYYPYGTVTFPSCWWELVANAALRFEDIQPPGKYEVLTADGLETESSLPLCE